MDFIWYMKKWQWGLVVAALGACLLLTGVLADRHQANDVAVQRATIEDKVEVAVGRLEQAGSVVEARKGDYPMKYSQDFPEELQRARERLGEGGDLDRLLDQLTDSQKDREWRTAYDLLKELDAIVAQDVGVVDRILGPPNTTGQGWYDILDQKSAAVDNGLLDKVSLDISVAKAYVDGLPRKARCDSALTLSFTRAYAKIAEAQAQLATAYQTLDMLVDGVVDKPLVYDQAIAAQSSAQGATDSGNADATDVELAYSSIIAADSAIDSAGWYISGSNYRQSDAMFALDDARSTLVQAKQACYDENFASAISLANDAQNQAYSAERIAATPEPTSTPVPIVISSDDDDDGFSFGSSGGGSGGWDSGSGDTGGWDSGGWDSGGGSDGGGWDSGGGDDGGGW